jgi:hypothetical protein
VNGAWQKCDRESRGKSVAFKSTLASQALRSG